MDDNQPVTKHDLTALKEEIINEISGVIADAMHTVAIDFQELKGTVGSLDGNVQELKEDVRELKEDVQELQIGQTRIENKLDPTIEKADDLAITVAKLQQQAT